MNGCLYAISPPLAGTDKKYWVYCLFFLILLPGFISAQRLHENLIEYSVGVYSDFGGYCSYPISIWPSLLRIDIDGTILFLEGEKYWIGRIEAPEMLRLKKSLENIKWLKKDTFFHAKKGRLISFGGGVFFVRYLDGPMERILATDLFPVEGPVFEIVKKMKGAIPSKNSLYLPTGITGVFEKVDNLQTIGQSANFPEWLFPVGSLELGSEIAIDDSLVIKKIFEHIKNNVLGLHFEFRLAQSVYSFRLLRITDWYDSEDEKIRQKLFMLRDQWDQKHLQK